MGNENFAVSVSCLLHVGYVESAVVRCELRASLVTRLEATVYVNSDASHSQFRSQFALGLDGTLQDRLSPAASRGPEIISRANCGWHCPEGVPELLSWK